MTNPEIYIGNTKLNSHELKVSGGYIEMDGERYYRIDNYDRMPPFLMNIVSASDQWMFIFQEINDALSLPFQYGWFNSDRFGGL